MEKENIAIVWNIFDVTPSINSTFVKGLSQYARSIGKISVQRVYGDWTQPVSATTTQELHDAGFEMVHIPVAAKDELTLILGTWLIDLINRNPHLDRIMLVSGDAGLEPVLQQIHGHGVQTTVICDARHADEQVLVMAEEFKDFRDLTLAPLEEQDEPAKQPSLSLEESFILLQEAVAYIENEEGRPSLSAVHARLKLMNEGFDENSLGFQSWNAYLAEAEKRKIVKTRFKEGRVVISIPGSSPQEKEKLLPTIVSLFLEALKTASEKTITSEGKKAKLSAINRALKESGIDYREHGYSSLKKVADAAAKRGLVFVSLKGSDYLLDLTKRGSQHLQ